MGITEYHSGDTVDTVFKNADKDMYENKMSMKKRICRFYRRSKILSLGGHACRTEPTFFDLRLAPDFHGDRFGHLERLPERPATEGRHGDYSDSLRFRLHCSRSSDGGR